MFKVCQASFASSFSSVANKSRCHFAGKNRSFSNEPSYPLDRERSVVAFSLGGTLCGLAGAYFLGREGFNKIQQSDSTKIEKIITVVPFTAVYAFVGGVTAMTIGGLTSAVIIRHPIISAATALMINVVEKNVPNPPTGEKPTE